MNKYIKKIILYIFLLFIILFVFLLTCHYISLNKHSEEIEILQAETPNFDVIQDLINKNQPTVFRQTLYGWEPIIHIFDANMDDINYLINNNNNFNKDILDCLSSYSMFLSLGWEYKFLNKHKDTRENHFVLQKNHRHLFAQIMGIQRFYLIPPNQKQYIETKTIQDEDNNKQIVSKTNFWNKNETAIEPFNKIKYIEIILREGNILYIPKGWWYLRVQEDDNLLFEAVNISIFSFINIFN